MTEPTPDVVTELFDLTGVALSELLAIDNPQLVASLAQVIQEEKQRQNIVAGFQSAI